jgi:hypothetical protein
MTGSTTACAAPALNIRIICTKKTRIVKGKS